MPEMSNITGGKQLTIQLSPEHAHRLDELCAERNVTPGQLIGELLDKVRHRRGTDHDSPSGTQRANPWGQVWPG